MIYSFQLCVDFSAVLTGTNVGYVLLISGLGFRPMPPESNVESTLIWFKGSNPDNYKYWTEEIDRFLEGKHT